uniref:uncharacterized protein LOC122591678 n=1 Tax=Erigeron canadensis TaxID=72917 RepID=UPI001CB99E39|nr:uncharacterized protein LOC122591678 [Erigeron canadensis]
MKLDHLINEVKNDQIFGPLKAVIYTVEFQKRGLPHAHICLFLSPDHKFPTATHVDQLSMYGSTRMHQKISKDETSVDDDGYPVYRRRNTGRTVEKNGVPLDNRFVVPYNASLLRKYQCHMNVEWCNQSGSIKYLFKYINKGPDRVTTAIYETSQQKDKDCTEKIVDEVKNYLDCRYVSACEAAWRIHGYDIHYRWPPVEILPFHDKDKQTIVYDENANLCDVVTNPTVKQSMFIQWMKLNKVDPFARTLLYVNFPRHYVWIRKDRKWEKRTHPGGSIGRISYVPPSLGDIYYLRMLLNHVRGPYSWKQLKTFNGQTFETYKEVCEAMGLLSDDKEYVEAIEEASSWATGAFLHHFFVMLLLSNSITSPVQLWSKTWKFLSEYIQHRQRSILNCPGLVLQEDELKNLCLSDIEGLLRANGSTLTNFPDMPCPDEEYAVDKNEGGVFFVYGYGGTGKTFLWKTLRAAVRSRGDIVLNVASSGIASLLLEGGRTTHSRFIIPIHIVENSVCSIDPQSDLAGLIKETKLIIWDEAPMIHKHCFEALDRSMRDILGSDTPNSENFGVWREGCSLWWRL